MSARALLKQRRTEILAVAARHGASNIRIIGSVARGDDDEKSDIDLLVQFEPGRSILDQAALIDDLAQLLGRKVDVASDDGLRPRVQARVLPEAIAL